MKLRAISLTFLILALALMLPFEETVTRILGVICIFAFVATGLFAVASPGFLAQRDEEG